MRQRLSAKFSLGQKIVVTFLLLFLLIFSGIIGKTFNYYPESPIIAILIYALLAAGCFALVQFLMKERRIVEFDDENLYIAYTKDRQERAIPLRNLIKMTLRPPGVEMGAYWFWTYSLSFTGDTGMEENIRFLMQVGKLQYQQFLSLVGSKNPDFKVKNWTFY